MRARVATRVGYELLLVSVLNLLIALPVLAAAPIGSELDGASERIPGGGSCEPPLWSRTGAHENCSGGRDGPIWRW